MKRVRGSGDVVRKSRKSEQNMLDESRCPYLMLRTERPKRVPSDNRDHQMHEAAPHVREAV